MPLSTFGRGSDGNPRDLGWTVVSAFRVATDFLVGDLEGMEVVEMRATVDGEALVTWERVDRAGESV